MLITDIRWLHQLIQVKLITAPIGEEFSTTPTTSSRHRTIPIEVPVHLQLIVGSDDVSSNPPPSTPARTPTKRPDRQRFFTQPTIPFRRPNNWYFPSTAAAREEHRGTYYIRLNLLTCRTGELSNWVTWKTIFFFRWIGVLCYIGHNRSVNSGCAGAGDRRHQLRGFLPIETNGLAVGGVDDAVWRSPTSKRFAGWSLLPQHLRPETYKGRNTEGLTSQRHGFQFLPLSRGFTLSGSLGSVSIAAIFFSLILDPIFRLFFFFSFPLKLLLSFYEVQRHSCSKIRSCLLIIIIISEQIS